MGAARTIGLGLARGVVAGAAGTAAMTGAQYAAARLRGQPFETKVPRTWADAPAPARLAKRLADLAGKGRKVTKKDVPWLTNAMHWGYGIAWGTAYGAAAAGERATVLRGPAFGAAVWGTSYAELVPLGIYEPPWRYPAEEVALDLAYHLVYGVTVAATYALLARG